MDSCHYTGVETDSIKDGTSDQKITQKYLLRQIFICTGLWASNFCYGLSFGSPAVFIAQIRREANSTDAVSSDTASWLSSTYNYSGTVCTFILVILAKYIGKKRTYLLVSIISSIGSIIFYFSSTITHLLISEIIHGPLAACPTALVMVMLTEYTSPRYRGVFLTMKSATFFWGVWVANTIGTFFDWKNIAVLSFVCSAYSILTIAFYPESPYWLANNNRFEDSARAHRWLKGSSKESEEELEKLMQSMIHSKSKIVESRNKFKEITRIMKNRAFCKPISLAFLVVVLYNVTGKVACGMYSLDIIKRITKTESSAYKGMLILDAITVLGTYVGCALSKILKRKILLTVLCTIGTMFSFMLSIYLYLIHLGIILENAILSIVLLIMYSLALSIGPLIICTTIASELIPIKNRNLSILVLGSFAQLILATILKICPFLMDFTGLHGLFLFFSLLSSVCIFAIYKFVPETKDKTLLEIQRSILGSKSNLNESELLHK